MELFEDLNTSNHNLLPREGTVNYYGKIFTATESQHYFDILFKNIEWKNDESHIYGKTIITKRKVAWYADKPYEYRYSGSTKTALLFTDELLTLKNITEQRTGETFNSCLLNLYHDGNEGMSWHSDAEKEIKKNGAIASLSFGAERKFLFRHKVDKTTVSLILQNGSLLVMKDDTQTNWVHRLPPTKLILKPRINLTFRTIVFQ